MKKLALLLFIGFLISPVMAIAAENLRFHEAKSYKERQIVAFIEKTNKTKGIPYIVATVDLNNDALNEYIIKPTSVESCTNRPLCVHQIIAFKNRVPTLLGEFDAHKMMISDKKAYGIRHIIVYNVPYNDFKSETAIWSPFTSRFQLP